MIILQSIRAALRALTANKMRSSLTILGIVIGVAAVVALMALGNGATASITSSIEGIGSNLIYVMPGNMQGGMDGNSTSGIITVNDYELLKSNLSNVNAFAPIYQGSFTINQEKESYRKSITGSTEDFLKVRAYTIASGRNITSSDRRSENKVAILGFQTADDLFGGLNPLGRSFKVNGISFKVIGVLEEKGSSGFDNANDLILVPLETGYTKLFGSASMQNGERVLSNIYMTAASANSVDGIIAQSKFLLRKSHQLAASEDADFSIISQDMFLSTLSGVTATLTIFLGAIAGISLLVGGIGIMNIMLVSVTERTREIGLRKAVGARKSQILLQFLVETITLTVLGGIIGILIGMGIAWLSTTLNLITAQVTLNSIIMSFSFAVAIGVFFGIYPAYRAARLHPMEALRYE